MHAVAERSAGHAEHFTLAQRALGFVTWIWNGTGDRAQWLGDLSPLLGLPPGSFSGGYEDYQRALHPDDVPASRRTLKECIKGDRPEYRTEERVVWPDGSVHWLETYGRATYGADGSAVNLSGVVRDVTDRKRLEEERARSEEKFAIAFEACPDYIIIIRAADQRIIDANPAFRRGIGFSAADAVGRTSAELGLWVHECEREKFFAALRVRGAVENFVAEIRLHGGRIIHAILAASTTTMNGERVVISTARDLTELEIAQQRSLQAERKFRAVFETSPEPMSITRMRDSRVLELNDACARQIGLPREAMLGRPTTDLADYVNPADRDDVMRQLATEGMVGNRMTRLRRQDGTEMDLLESCKTIEIEGETCIVWSWRDVTAIRQAERALSHSELRYRTLFNSSLNTLLVFAPDGRLVDTNAAGCACMKLTREQMLGMSYRDLLGPGVLEQVMPEAENIRNLRSLQTECIVEGADGELRHMEIAAGLLPDGNVLAIVRDISKRKRAELALADLNASLEQRVRERTSELEAANRELDSFSHSVSHDLRAPLLQISGFANLLRRDRASSLSADAVRFLERIEHGTDQMGQLLESLLEFARTGRAALQRGPVDMQAMVGEVLLMLRGPESARAEISVADLPPVKGDALLLRQVWQNLLGNALKFSRYAQAPQIEVGAERREGIIEFFVRDNGAGFDMKRAGKLFDVFERLHTDKEFEGTGAGLSIVKRIVERHGGWVAASGEPGRGACLRFTLPA